MLQSLQLSNSAPVGRELLGCFAQASDFDTLVQTSTRVLRPDGTTLCVLLKGALSKAAGGAMFRAVRNRIGETRNRGVAAGGKAPQRVLANGYAAKTREAINVRSSIMGYFGRNPRLPFCRPTAFAANYPQAYRACLPALVEADGLFAEHMPEAYARQAAMAARTHPDFVIDGTVFTTITLNKNFRTAYHKDAGDLPEGFGVMSYYRAGRFGGGELVFPRWRVALRPDSLDLVLFDPHEIHGNTAIVPYTDDWQRITCVHYYRADMVYCGSAEAELKLAANHDPKAGPRNLKAAARMHLDA